LIDTLDMPVSILGRDADLGGGCFKDSALRFNWEGGGGGGGCEAREELEGLGGGGFTIAATADIPWL